MPRGATIRRRQRCGSRSARVARRRAHGRKRPQPLTVLPTIPLEVPPTEDARTVTMPGAATTAFRGRRKTRPRPPEPRRLKRTTRRAGQRPAGGEEAGREGCPSLREPAIRLYPRQPGPRTAVHGEKVEDAAFSTGSASRPRSAACRERRLPRAPPAGRPPGAPFVAHWRLSDGDGHEGPFLADPRHAACRAPAAPADGHVQGAAAGAGTGAEGAARCEGAS